MMPHFCFYFGRDESLLERMRSVTSLLWDGVEEISSDTFSLFVRTDDYSHSLVDTDSAMGAVTGWAQYDRPGVASAEQTDSAMCDRHRLVNEICDRGHWPLSEQWTGSFGAVAYSKNRQEVTICNDILGYLPVYYATTGESLIGGTQLMPLASCGDFEVDVVGLLQRITPPYCNYGRRSMFRRVSRLLPGEWRTFSAGAVSKSIAFDNSLCKGDIIDADIHLVARDVWNSLQHEIELAVTDRQRVCVALSGGWDSRLVLRGVAPHVSAIDCLTYGNEEHYETTIAKRCARAVGADHHCFPIEDKYFPRRSDLELLVRETESANYMEWYGILDGTNGAEEPRSTLLLGDLCESLVGRYLGGFSSRRDRMRSFLNGVSGRSECVEAATANEFHSWKMKKREIIIAQVLANIEKLSPSLAEQISVSDLQEGMNDDLELSFSRVRAHMPPYVPMFDELFSWFHRVRFLLANQLVFLASRFEPVCPAISMRFLRLITRVHPKLRIRGRLMHGIAHLREFDELAAIPSAQIPWIGARAPTWFRELLWGMRCGIDQALILSVIKSRNIQRRQRVVKSLNYINEYQRHYVVPRVSEWYSGSWIQSESYVRIAADRATLNSWPLIGVDISAPANISILLDLCRTQVAAFD